MPAPVVEGDASEADAGPVPGGQVIRAASSASSSSATPTLTEVSGAAGNIFASNLVGTPQQIDNFDEEIRRAVLAGDEATAYRLVRERIPRRSLLWGGQYIELSNAKRSNHIYSSHEKITRLALKATDYKS